MPAAAPILFNRHRGQPGVVIKLEPWDPDLRSLIGRLRERDIDPQPDFQRGLAWNRAKQARLIDTVLRGWSIPALHFIVLEDETLAVLDGQQRLHSLSSFVDDELPVREFAPVDSRIESYKGKRFSQLPAEVQRRVWNYKVPSYRLYDYTPEEPNELFFRLNLPTGLTQAEKRNSLIGESRRQVRELVDHALSIGWDRHVIGFENTRLAYDDVIARACLYVDGGNLRLPITSGRMEDQFRSPVGFSSKTVHFMSQSVETIHDSLTGIDRLVRLNKATLLTWLLVAARIARNSDLADVNLRELISEVEVGRTLARNLDSERAPTDLDELFALYDDRASLRVTDVLSVVARDAVVWICAARRNPRISAAIEGLTELEEVTRNPEKDPFHDAGDALMWELDKNSKWTRL